MDTDARLAAAFPETASFALFDGSWLEAGELRVETAPTARLELVRVVGDLTGQPQESALVVRSERALPLGDLLAGQTVNVEHPTGGAHTSAYETEKVSPFEDDLYRIDLRYHPPFIRRKLTVTSVGTFVSVHDGHPAVRLEDVPPANRGRPGPVEVRDPKLITQRVVPPAEPGDLYLGITHKLHDGVARPNTLGRRLWFPRTGFRTTTINSQQVGGYAGWWSVGLVPAERPGDKSRTFLSLRRARPGEVGNSVWRGESRQDRRTALVAAGEDGRADCGARGGIDAEDHFTVPGPGKGAWGAGEVLHPITLRLRGQWQLPDADALPGAGVTNEDEATEPVLPYDYYMPRPVTLRKGTGK